MRWSKLLRSALMSGSYASVASTAALALAYAGLALGLAAGASRTQPRLPR